MIETILESNGMDTCRGQKPLLEKFFAVLLGQRINIVISVFYLEGGEEDPFFFFQ